MTPQQTTHDATDDRRAGGIDMIYLQRHSLSADGSPSVEIAVIEDDHHAERLAQRYEARGYTRCSIDEFRAAWRLRDERDLAWLRAAAVAEYQRVAS